jgi:hypothetical protein
MRSGAARNLPRGRASPARRARHPREERGRRRLSISQRSKRGPAARQDALACFGSAQGELVCSGLAPATPTAQRPSQFQRSLLLTGGTPRVIEIDERPGFGEKGCSPRTFVFSETTRQWSAGRPRWARLGDAGNKSVDPGERRRHGGRHPSWRYGMTGDYHDSVTAHGMSWLHSTARRRERRLRSRGGRLTRSRIEQDDDAELRDAGGGRGLGSDG